MKEKLNLRIISENRAFLMGVSIITILVFHYGNLLVACHEPIDWFNRAFFYFIGPGGVDVFLALSGMGLYFSFKRNSELGQFYRKRIVRLFIPYLIIAGARFTWAAILNLGSAPFWPSFLQNFFFISFFTRGNSAYWYVLHMFMCYLIFPFVFRLVESERIDRRISFFGLVIAVTAFTYWFSLANPTLFGRINIMLTRYAAFFFGCYLGKMVYDRRELKISYIVGSVLCLGSVFFLTDYHAIITRYARSIFCISLFFLCMLFYVLVLKRFKFFDWIYRVCEWFGRYTLELYLLHVSLINVFGWLGLKQTILINYCLMIATSIVLAVIIKKLEDKITAIVLK